MKKNRRMRTIYRMIDCGQVSELSKEEKEDAMKALSTELVFISHTGDCKVRVERRLWVINRRLAMLQEAPPNVTVWCKLHYRYNSDSWSVVHACDVSSIRCWFLDLHKYKDIWRLAWIEGGVEIIIWDFDSYEDAVAWLRDHVYIVGADGEHEKSRFELLLQAVAPTI